MANITTPAKAQSYFFRGNLRARPPISSKTTLRTLIELLPWWRTDITGTCTGPAFFAVNRAGAFNGTVLDGSVPVPYAKVHLYHKPNGMLIKTAICTDAGAFQFKGLDKASSDYFAVAHYPNDNAQVYDSITPA